VALPPAAGGAGAGNLRALQRRAAAADVAAAVHAEVHRACPGREPPLLAAARPARPHKSAIGNEFGYMYGKRPGCLNAREGPDSGPAGPR
jgi:hypothetical protein